MGPLNDKFAWDKWKWNILPFIVMQNKPRLSLDVYYSECIQIFHLYLGANSYKEKDLSLNINNFLFFLFNWSWRKVLISPWRRIPGTALCHVWMFQKLVPSISHDYFQGCGVYSWPTSPEWGYQTDTPESMWSPLNWPSNFLNVKESQRWHQLEDFLFTVFIWESRSFLK